MHTHKIKTVLLHKTVEEFIELFCTLINNILYRKVEIESDNFIYNAAKRLSIKYIIKDRKKKQKYDSYIGMTSSLFDKHEL